MTSLYIAATQQKSMVNAWVEKTYKDVIKYVEWFCNMIYIMCPECVSMDEAFMNDLKGNVFLMIYKYC